MLVTTYDLHGHTGPLATLTRDRSEPLPRIDGKQVLAVSIWRHWVALTLLNHLVLVNLRDFERVNGYGCLLSVFTR